ncbi:MAG TPA: BrxA/BrxB family bacilliredoxin [Planctomycetes bacterium]|nr:BrxA/BrxB family bacilliredoxin [Planctomycetota bacterium]
MYDEAMVAPMRAEVTTLGVKECRTPEDVDAELKDFQGTALVFVNSVCGCAAGGARPGLALALQHGKKPDKLLTVFAGQDREATQRARDYFVGYPPTSPQIGLLKDGRIVAMMQRHDIEGRMPIEIANRLVALFEENC